MGHCVGKHLVGRCNLLSLLTFFFDNGTIWKLIQFRYLYGEPKDIYAISSALSTFGYVFQLFSSILNNFKYFKYFLILDLNIINTIQVFSDIQNIMIHVGFGSGSSDSKVLNRFKYYTSFGSVQLFKLVSVRFFGSNILSPLSVLLYQPLFICCCGIKPYSRLTLSSTGRDLGETKKMLCLACEICQKPATKAMFIREQGYSKAQQTHRRNNVFVIGVNTGHREAIEEIFLHMWAQPNDVYLFLLSNKEVQ